MSSSARFLLCLAVGFPGLAAAEVPSSTQLGALRGHFLSGTPDLAGIAVSVTAIEGLEIEAAYAPWVHRLQLFVPHDDSFLLRAGPRFALFDGRDEVGFGLAIHVAGRVGARIWRAHEWTGWDTPARERTLAALSATAGVQITLWLVAHLGLELELLAGGSLWLSEAPEGVGPIDLRASIGWAF